MNEKEMNEFKEERRESKKHSKYIRTLTRKEFEEIEGNDAIKSRKLDSEILQLLHQRYKDPHKIQEEFERKKNNSFFYAIKISWDKISKDTDDEIRNLIRRHGHEIDIAQVRELRIKFKEFE